MLASTGDLGTVSEMVGVGFRERRGRLDWLRNLRNWVLGAEEEEEEEVELQWRIAF